MTDPATYINGRTVQEQMNSLIGYVDQRSAEVAVDAIASDVAQVAADKADAHADALAAAASAAAAAGTLANAVKKTGEASQSIAGDISVAGVLTGGTVTVPTPTNNTDAATKKYVDDADALKLNITDVNSYAVGLTGNQTVAGTKTRTGQDIYEKGNYGTNVFKHTTADVVNNPGAGERFIGINFVDMNGVSMVNLRAGIASNGKCVLGGTIRNSDGTTKYFTIVSGD